jgi:hypothetical protein
MEISHFFYISHCQLPVDLCINMWKSSFAEKNIRINLRSTTLYRDEDSTIILVNAVLLKMMTVDNSLYSCVSLSQPDMVCFRKHQMDTVTR